MRWLGVGWKSIVLEWRKTPCLALRIWYMYNISLVTASLCLHSSLCHCRHHLVPCVCPPWDHHRELRLLSIRRLDWCSDVPCGWLCHCLLLWRCPVIWWKPFLLFFGIQLPYACQERPCIESWQLAQEVLWIWVLGPRFCLYKRGKLTPLPGSKFRV